MKKLVVVGALLALAGCAGMYAEHTEVKLFRPDGTPLASAYSNKGYDGFYCNAKFNKDGTGSVIWKANKVNSNTVAKEALETNRELTKSFTGVMRRLAGLPAPNPFTGR